MPQAHSAQNTAHQPKLFAHRGTSILAPENTAAAFDLALQFKCDVLETDVRLSKDGVVMVTHDETLDRTTNGIGYVRDYTAMDLKKLDASAKFVDAENHGYTSGVQQIMTLNELFDQYPSVGINIDIKDRSNKAATAVAKVIANQASAPERWINVGSFHAPIMQHFRSIAPQVSTAATRQEVARLVFGSTKTIAPAYKVLQIPASYFGIRLDRPRFINKVQALGCEIIYWTINESRQMNTLLTRGCNGIVSDRPDVALEVFQQHGLKLNQKHNEVTQ